MDLVHHAFTPGSPSLRVRWPQSKGFLDPLRSVRGDLERSLYGLPSLQGVFVPFIQGYHIALFVPFALYEGVLGTLRLR